MTSERNGEGSWRRSCAIVRAAFQALRGNPRLLWFPVLSGLGALVLLAVGAAIAGAGALGPDPEASTRRTISVAGIVVYVGGHLLTVGIGVAMTHAALESLAGRPWTVGEALQVASRRRRSVASFAMVTATVGYVLRGGQRRGKRTGPGLLRRIAGVAWWAATYLALPVLAREDRSGIGAIERSATLFRSTWKEIALARLTLWWAWIPVVIVAAVPMLACAVLGVREPEILVPAVALPLFGLGLFALFVRTLDGIYRAALYTYATEGVIPEPFDDEELAAIWQARGGSDGE